MKYDIILSGVGGQGVLSLAAIIATSAMKEKLAVKQSEVHGMAQRGGAVISHLRLSDEEIASDLIPKGSASMIISIEPLESLRYLPYLAKDGVLITSTDPFINITDYPETGTLLKQLKSLPKSVLVDSKKIALEAGNSKAVNTVMLGAASEFLPFNPETLREVIGNIFKRKGEKVVELNLIAFDKGREASK